MKGLVFTEFLKMVDEKFSPEMVEKIIDASDLATQGAYTTVGTYDHHELVRLITHLSSFTNIPIPELEVTYGKYLFKTLLNRYAKFIFSSSSLFEFLQQIDQHIHVEVRKIYPDAELPQFNCKVLSPHSMTMLYSSNRPFANLAEGLMLGCAEHFKENIKIQRETLPPKNDKKNVALFTLTKQE